MSVAALPVSAPATSAAPSRRWPAIAAAWYVGVFCAVAGGAVVWTMIRGASVGENGVVLLAVNLRLLTVAMALASVQSWGRLVPRWMLLAGLWGAAAVQLVYPVAETVVKGLILAGAMDPIDKGISNMTPEGWFNFGATWTVWGVPGVLFTLAALAYGAKARVRAGWILFGILGGVALLGGLGLLVG